MSELSKGWAGVVAALGATAILGYGAIFYAFPILVPFVAAEFGVTPATLFGIFSIGLFLGGVLSSRFGGWLDRFGAPRVMTVASAAVAGLFAGLAAAPNIWVYGALIVTLEAISFLVLYDAAFAALALRVPRGTRQAITRLTLIGGFASTLFWPLTGWMVESIGWRGCYMVFAGLHLMIALPLHGWVAALSRKISLAAQTEALPAPDRATLPQEHSKRAFWLLGVSFALTGTTIAAFGVHLVPVLLDRGLGQTAYLVGMAMGPTQVLVRVVDATLWRGFHPLKRGADAFPAAQGGAGRSRSFWFHPSGDGACFGPPPQTPRWRCSFRVPGKGWPVYGAMRCGGAGFVSYRGGRGWANRLGQLAGLRKLSGAAAAPGDCLRVAQENGWAVSNAVAVSRDRSCGAGFG